MEEILRLFITAIDCAIPESEPLINDYLKKCYRYAFDIDMSEYKNADVYDRALLMSKVQNSVVQYQAKNKMPNPKNKEYKKEDLLAKVLKQIVVLTVNITDAEGLSIIKSDFDNGAFTSNNHKAKSLLNDSSNYLADKIKQENERTKLQILRTEPTPHLSKTKSKTKPKESKFKPEMNDRKKNKLIDFLTRNGYTSQAESLVHFLNGIPITEKVTINNDRITDMAYLLCLLKKHKLISMEGRVGYLQHFSMCIRPFCTEWTNRQLYLETKKYKVNKTLNPKPIANFVLSLKTKSTP